MTTLTQNGAVALASTSDPLLDFHNFTTRGTDFKQLVPYLKEICNDRVYTYNGETFSGKYFLVKYLAYLRKFRGQGKGERQLFIQSLDWLSKAQPEIFDGIFDGGFIEKWGCWRDYLKLENKALKERIVNKFADQIFKDIHDFPKISLCAKWAPSEGCAKGKNIFPQLVRKLVSMLREEMFGFEIGGKDIDLSASEKSIYRKVMSALREQLKIVETYICQNNLAEINYDHVPGLAQNRYTKIFKAKDMNRYQNWISEKTKKAAAALSGQPSLEKIVNIEALTLVDLIKNCKTTEMGEIQFNVMLADALKEQNWGNIITVADMSGSMESGQSSVKPIDVSLIMALFTSCISAHKNSIWQKADPRFFPCWCASYLQATEFLTGDWYSFSSKPRKNTNCAMWRNAEGQTFPTSLSDMIKFTNRADWGQSTNFEAMYNALLEQPLDYEALIVISDMQFNECINKSNETNLENLKNRFRQAERIVPKIVFWNVNSSTPNVAAGARDSDVMIVSGFSHTILNDITSCSLQVIPYNPLNNLLEILQHVEMT